MQKSKSQDKKVISKDTPLDEVLKLGKVCNRSGHCCSYGSGFVLVHEVKGLAKHFKMSEEKFIEKFLDEKESFNTKHYRFKIKKEEGKHYGPCVFLGKDMLCKIHDFKPLHCRVGNCSEDGQDLSIWFALKNFVDKDDPESVRQWAVYLKTHPTIKGGKLEDLVPDKKRLKKILSYEIFR